MEKTILISMIMPNFNGEKYIEETILCFLEQKYTRKELIIIDGKSVDNSHEIIKTYSEYYSCIKWLKIEDKGISDAINIGLEIAEGDIIGYLGSDDYILNGTFEKLNEMYFKVRPDAIYFDSYTFFKNENKCVLRKVPEIAFSRENLLKHGTIVGLQNIFFKKDILERYKYNKKNKYSMDYELYLEIFSNENPLFVYVNQPATINIFDENITYTQASNQNEEAFHVAAKYTRGIKEQLYVYRRFYGKRKFILMWIFNKLRGNKKWKC